MQKILGKVIVVWKRGWDVSTKYTKLDAVNYSGSSYICIDDNTPIGTIPTNNIYWDYLCLASTVNPDDVKQIIAQELASRGI